MIRELFWWSLNSLFWFGCFPVFGASSSPIPTATVRVDTPTPAAPSLPRALKPEDLRCSVRLAAPFVSVSPRRQDQDADALPLRRERFQRAPSHHRADVSSLTQPRRAGRAGDLPRPKPQPQETELHHRPVPTLSRLVCEIDLSRKRRRAVRAATSTVE